MISHFHLTPWLLALTCCDVGYWGNPGEEGCLLTERKRLTCDLSVYPNCPGISILYLKYLELQQALLSILAEYSTSWAYLQTAPSSRNAFFLSKWCDCQAQEKKIGDTPACCWSPVLFLLLFILSFRPPTWSDAISSGSVNPHVSPVSGPTESPLANVSLFWSTPLHNHQGHLISRPAESARHTKNTPALTQMFTG